MKKILLIILVVSIYSCGARDYKYKITGQAPLLIERQVDLTEVNVTQELRPVVAYTDTIYGRNPDSVWYYNSDGSKVTVHKPYTIYKLK